VGGHGAPRGGLARQLQVPDHRERQLLHGEGLLLHQQAPAQPRGVRQGLLAPRPRQGGGAVLPLPAQEGGDVRGRLLLQELRVLLGRLRQLPRARDAPLGEPGDLRDPLPEPPGVAPPPPAKPRRRRWRRPPRRGVSTLVTLSTELKIKSNQIIIYYNLLCF